ncbi:MAG: L-histidine N(alpha)-methyltransferase [Deltaproteobacteria bacterium]|nr:L-histidine N(alpha)-methyltransferase [Deltaproteobacteria bacterium]
MEDRNKPPIIAPDQHHLWRPAEASIWTLKEDHCPSNPSLTILRTLLDQPPWLEAHLLYDERGSQLFEQICKLPEYYLTRTENSILAAKATDMIAAAPVQCIVELGSGTSQKTLHLLREQVRQRHQGIFAPIDVSLTSLGRARDSVRRLLPQLDFHGLLARYEDGFSGIDKNLPTLFAFLGSSVGNFTHVEFVRFFQRLGDSMGPRDYLLLGVDRVKDPDILEKAYDDSQGVTAEFILNVFRNINRAAGSNFDIEPMRYHSRYNSEWQRVEMYALTTAAQKIRFPSLGATLVWQKGEKILVEISRKFEPEKLKQQLQCFGLEPVEHFTDPKGWFSLLLLKKAENWGQN